MSLNKDEPKDELVRSLKQIKVTYERSKERLEKDLNKMEYQVTQIRDTRERISIKHLKSLDIVQREINRIMPNDLTGKADLNQESDCEFDIEAIRNDLQDDDVFSIAYRKDSSIQNPEETRKSSNALPQEEWIESSDSQDVQFDRDTNEQLELTGLQDLKLMQQQ